MTGLFLPSSINANRRAGDCRRRTQKSASLPHSSIKSQPIGQYLFPRFKAQLIRLPFLTLPHNRLIPHRVICQSLDEYHRATNLYLYRSLLRQQLNERRRYFVGFKRSRHLYDPESFLRKWGLFWTFPFVADDGYTTYASLVPGSGDAWNPDFGDARGTIVMQGSNSLNKKGIGR